MATEFWKELPAYPSTPMVMVHYTVELEGILLQFRKTGWINKYSYRVFRYIDIDTSWERLENNDSKDMSLFVGEKGASYAARKQGLKLYSLNKSVCHVRELVYQIAEKIHLCVALTNSASWVDLG